MCSLVPRFSPSPKNEWQLSLSHEGHVAKNISKTMMYSDIEMDYIPNYCKLDNLSAQAKLSCKTAQAADVSVNRFLLAC